MTGYKSVPSRKNKILRVYPQVSYLLDINLFHILFSLFTFLKSRDARPCNPSIEEKKQEDQGFKACLRLSTVVKASLGDMEYYQKKYEELVITSLFGYHYSD